MSEKCIAADDSYIINASQVRFIENGEEGISIWFADNDADDEPWILTYEEPEQQVVMYERLRQAMLG